MQTGLTIDRDIYKYECRKFKKMCGAAKSMYYNDKVNQCVGDQKSLFKIANELLHKQRPVQLPSYKEPEEIANRFATYFEDKIKVIGATFGPVDSRNLTQPHKKDDRKTHMLDFETVNEKYLKKTILAGNSKSCSLDPIPTKLLKKHLEIILPTLLNIVNMSLSAGIFPSPLKKALVTPLLKKTSLDKEILKNYRPVSNLAFLGKLIEHVVVQQLTGHKTRNNLYAVYQSAYREGHSTETALLRIMNDILLLIDGKKCVMLVLLDLSAAFDTLEHSVLLSRLENENCVSGNVLAWMRSYLHNRTVSVITEGVQSRPTSLTVGLPQGSKVGPSEYLTYSSPIFDIAHKHQINIHMYADDTQLYLGFDSDNFNEAARKMEKCLEEIKEWMWLNHLKLNEDKTEYLLIGRSASLKQIPEPNTLCLGASVIEPTRSAKNIGVIVDAELSMIPHVNNICKACYGQLRSIARIRPNLTEEATKTLVHSFVTSRLDSCNSILYGLSDQTLHKLQLVQNSAARIITRTKRHEHITPILKRLHWLPIKYRIVYKICLTVFKCLQGKAPEYLSSLIERYVPTRALRSSNTNLLKHYKVNLKTFGERSFASAAPRLWNVLPDWLRSSSDLEQFKTDLKTHLFTLAYPQ